MSTTSITPFEAGYAMGAALGPALFVFIVVFIIQVIFQKLAKNKMNWLRTGVISFAFFLLAFIPLSLINVNQFAPANYESEFKKGFMGSCVKEPEFQAFCECSADRILKDMTFQELSEFASKQAENPSSEAEVPQKMQDAIAACISLLEVAAE